MLSNAIKHYLTITKHRHKVMAHCFRAGIFWQGLLHDLSKYQPPEFIAGVLFYQGYRSPNEAEREAIGYSAAWMHHKGRNRHHFEYWTDYNPQTRTVQTIEMPIRFVVEMFCDRVAASKIYRGENYTDSDPLEYFLGAKGKRTIHPATSDLIEELLTELSQKGEDAVFDRLRTMVRQERKSHRWFKR